MILQYGKERRKLSLGTPLKAAAAAKARDLYLAVLSNGWKATLDVLHGIKQSASTDTTVGQFLAELKTKADLKPKTLEGYAIAFRGIVAGIFGIEGGRDKYNYRSGGRDKWIGRIDAIRLADISPQKIQEWKRAFIARAGEDPIRLRSTRTSVNSLLRRAKSLFAPGAIAHLECVLPSPLPFTGIAFEPRQSMRYRSNIDAGQLTRDAQRELSQEDSPVFLAFLLALGAGLRRIEIDRLEWSAFRFEDNVVRIEPTSYFDVKTEHSIGDVQIDPELMSVFRGFAAIADSSFVIEGPNLPLTNATFENYRAQAVFERLSVWLRKHGVTARKPIHELRKEFGSMINRRHGLSAAKDQLRHADVSITMQHYVDTPRKAASGLGALLLIEDKKIVPFKDVG